MSDGSDKLSTATIAMHWLVAISIIGMLAFGLYLEDFPRGDEKTALMWWHRSIGTAVLGLVLLRILNRMRNRWPGPVGEHKSWETRLAHVVTAILLIGTLAMPLSGILHEVAGARPVDVFGLFTIPALAERNTLLREVSGTVHGLGGKLMIAAILLHVAGSLKHHVLDKDATLRRMLGARLDQA